MNSYPHTSTVMIPIITYSEVEQYVRDWISTGCSDYLKHVPKNELLAHCWMVGVDKDVIKRAYLSNGKDDLIKALISASPIVGSSGALTEDLQPFLNRSHDLYSVIHSKGRINTVRQVDRHSTTCNNNTSINVHQRVENSRVALNNSQFIGALELSKSSPMVDQQLAEKKAPNTSVLDEVSSPELSTRPRRKLRTSPKDKHRLREYKKRLEMK